MISSSGVEMGDPDTGSLIVEARNEDHVPWDSMEGGGLASSFTDYNAALGADRPDPFQVGYAGLGLALDALGTVMSPLDSLVEAGIGFLIEHVPFFHEALDALAGDPTQIAAQAETWHNVSVELQRIAQEYRAAADGVTTWDGSSREAYRAAAATFADQIHRTGGDADALGALILRSGAMVGTVRAVIRDMIATFVRWLIEQFLRLLAFGAATLGLSTPAIVTWAVAEATTVGMQISRRISRLLDDLEVAGGQAGLLTAAMRDSAAQVRAAVPGLPNSLAAFRRTRGAGWEAAADAVDAGSWIEMGKQFSGLRQTQNGWEQPAAPAARE